MECASVDLDDGRFNMSCSDELKGSLVWTQVKVRQNPDDELNKKTLIYVQCDLLVIES